MNYIKQLDSLRAVAVILVIISHWILPENPINSIPNGPIGVDIFFVLSGFLITKILFDIRDNADLSNIPRSHALKSFYARRTLRIFPIYYLVIFLMLFFAESSGTSIETSYVYYLTYTSNFYFFDAQHWDGVLSHLWSLAVEEQFYLIWPWMILFVNKKYFLPIIALFILTGTISQYMLSGVPMASILTFTCFDAFGLGAILSWVITYAPQKLEKFHSILSYVAAGFVVLFMMGIIQDKWSFIPARTLVCGVALWVVTYIVLNKDKNPLAFRFFLNNRILVFLGKISYGLYLYHNLIPELLNLKFINIYFNPLLPEVLVKTYWDQLYILENSILLLAISWFSFVFIEKRFLAFKRYFEYQTITNPLAIR